MALSGNAAMAISRKYTLDTVKGAGAIKGKSAYEIAVEHGFDGSEEEWFESFFGGGAETASDSEVEAMLIEVFGEITE